MVKKRTSRVKRRRKRGGAMKEAEDRSSGLNAARAAAATAEHRAATAEHRAAAETQAISITSSIPSVNKLDIGNLHFLLREIISEIIKLEGDVLRTTHPERMSSLEGKKSTLEGLLNETVPKLLNPYGMD